MDGSGILHSLPGVGAYREVGMEWGEDPNECDWNREYHNEKDSPEWQLVLPSIALKEAMFAMTWV